MHCRKRLETSLPSRCICYDRAPRNNIIADYPVSQEQFNLWPNHNCHFDPVNTIGHLIRYRDLSTQLSRGTSVEKHTVQFDYLIAGAIECLQGGHACYRYLEGKGIRYRDANDYKAAPDRVSFNDLSDSSAFP